MFKSEPAYVTSMSHFAPIARTQYRGLSNGKENAMRLAIIQAAVLAAMFLIAAAVSYHSGYVGGRVDGAMETEVAK